MKTEQLPQAVNPADESNTSRLLFGDCLKILPTLLDDSIDLLCSDPPYGVNYRSRSTKLPLRSIANDTFKAYDLLDRALAATYPKIKDGRWIIIFTNWQAEPSMRAIVEKYFAVKNILVWDKTYWTRGDMRGNWGYQYEMAIAARKGETRIRRLLSGKREGNVLRFKKVPSNHMIHPTEKSVELLQYLIEKTTKPGEVVLDMFFGSGSTLVAAKNLKRNYVGIELEKVWFDIAQKRLETAG